MKIYDKYMKMINIIKCENNRKIRNQIFLFHGILCIFIFKFYVMEQPFIKIREKILLCLQICQKEWLLLRSYQSEILFTFVKNI